MTEQEFKDGVDRAESALVENRERYVCCATQLEINLCASENFGWWMCPRSKTNKRIGGAFWLGRASTESDRLKNLPRRLLFLRMWEAIVLDSKEYEKW